MTFAEVLGVIARQWRAVLVGLLCTVVTMGAVVGRDGVYATQVDVIFLTPLDRTNQNVLVGDLVSLINFAAIVEREMNAGEAAPRMSSPTATLYGRGVREGYSVELPNTGGQWGNNFSRPVLNVQVVGPSPAEVTSTFEEVVRQIEQVAAARERAAGAPPTTWVSLRLSPAKPVIGYVPGGGKRAALALGALGAAGTVIGAVHLDRWRARRDRREPAVPVGERS